MSRCALAVGLTLVVAAAGRSQVVPLAELPQLRAGGPAFAATLMAYAGTPVLSGNRVVLLQNGDQIFPAKLEAVRRARKTINYVQYVFEEGAAAGELAHAFTEKCRAGVKVNILLDGFGSPLMRQEYTVVMRAAFAAFTLAHPSTGAGRA